MMCMTTRIIPLAFIQRDTTERTIKGKLPHRENNIYVDSLDMIEKSSDCMYNKYTLHEMEGI